MIVKLLTGHHLEFLSFKGGCTGLAESILVKMPHCWKSHATAQLFLTKRLYSLIPVLCLITLSSLSSSSPYSCLQLFPCFL